MAQPFVLIDLSKSNGQKDDGNDGLNRFLLAYTEEDESIHEVVVVDQNAVYKGGKGCVEKPRSMKNLSQADHLLKVRDALVQAAHGKGGEGAETNGGGREGGIALTLEVENSEARCTVKKTLKDGKSSVVLATAKLPKLDDGGGLLLGVVRAAFVRGEESKRLRRNLGKADGENVKLKGLLDKATNDKRRVIHGMMEKAALVVNSKKAMIATLQQDSDDESGESENEDDIGGRGGGAGDGEDLDASASEAANNNNDDDEHHNKVRPTAATTTAAKETASPSTTRKAKGKANDKSARDVGGKHAVKLKSGDQEGCAKRAASGSTRTKKESPAFGKGGDAIGVGVRSEAAGHEEHSDGEMGGNGWGALAVPLGTQEVSGEDLFRHVKRERDLQQITAENGGNNERGRRQQRRLHLDDDDGGYNNVYDHRRSRQPPPGDRNIAGATAENNNGRRFENARNEAQALIGSDSDSGSGSEKEKGATRCPARKRRRKKTTTPVKDGEKKEVSSGGGGVARVKSSGGGGGGGDRHEVQQKTYLGVLDISTDEEWDEDQLA